MTAITGMGTGLPNGFVVPVAASVAAAGRRSRMLPARAETAPLAPTPLTLRASRACQRGRL